MMPYKNKNKLRKYKAEWMQKKRKYNPEWAAQYWKKYPERRRAAALRQYWPGSSGQEALTKYNLMFTEQNGNCGACGANQSILDRRLGVDHCHTTGLVRGLLCNECNRAEGILKTSAQAEGLGKYMRKWGK
jgi:hypothetical protein